VQDISLRVLNVNAASLMLDGRRVPLDGKSTFFFAIEAPGTPSPTFPPSTC
jgi:hypothetical protein